MSTPLRGTQSLVGEMGWVFERPSLTALEVLWRWVVGLPLLMVFWRAAGKILIALPPETAGLGNLDPQNPWVAAGQLANAWALYQPHVALVLRWLLPASALGWAVVSGVGRNLVLRRMAALQGRKLQFRPLAMIALQVAWLALLAAVLWSWLRSMQWVAAACIPSTGEPDLVGFAVGAIFLSLGFFTAWALVSWPLAIAPLLMLLEERSVLSALGVSLRLGRVFTGKLVEINLVMGIVKLALMVLAMVLSAAPLPFSDQLGTETLHAVWDCSVIFYLVASDYFHVVRLKGFAEWWKIFRGGRAAEETL